MRKNIAALALIAALPAAGFAADVKAPTELLAPGVRVVDSTTLAADRNLYSGLDPLTWDQSVNVVVEIPAGTSAKWEVSRPDGLLKWEIKDGKPRIIKYLGYPVNYAAVPKTALPKEQGGDGDSIDLLLIGPPLPRGTVAAGKLIGLLRLVDGGEQDDKLVAVMPDVALSDVASIEEMDKKYPGVTTIIETWFTGYKGPGKVVSKGWGGPKEARERLDAAIKAYKDAGGK
jgi:inorganic pyrophosphatase